MLTIIAKRELECLHKELEELREENVQLTKNNCELEVKLFNTFGRELEQKLVDELELNSFQVAKLRLMFYIERCRLVGVPEEKILKNLDEINEYFTAGES